MGSTSERREHSICEVHGGLEEEIRACSPADRIILLSSCKGPWQSFSLMLSIYRSEGTEKLH